MKGKPIRIKVGRRKYDSLKAAADALNTTIDMLKRRAKDKKLFNKMKVTILEE